ncbi:MAG: UDP-N-acetylmuramate--L-alanine ligase [Nocardioidaceae bacterium]
MIVPVPDHIDPAEALGYVHFVGIGGAALSGLARIMVSRGVGVTGSDATASAMLDSLRGVGVQCWVGHDASHVEGADTVVVSTAVPGDNPEVRRALELGLRVWPRSAAVQSVLLGKTAVVVTGTHGKTTTTSMLTTALLWCGADPSYAIGSTLIASGLNAHDGAGDIFVAEGDESDGAILVYTPAAAVITNVDADHLDHFGSVASYARVFDDFLGRLRPGGFVICCVDDLGAARLATTATRRGIEVIRVGRSAAVDLRADALTFQAETSRFEVWEGNRRRGVVGLRVPGAHYASDALAALAAGLRLGFGFDDLAAGLATFRGSGRRMEFKGDVGGVRVYDAYAHHPTEIAADLNAARGLTGGGRLIVCFQPHLYSRTRIFGAAMGEALSAADEVVVMDVYAARERPEPGISGATVAAGVPELAGRVTYEPDRSRVAARVADRAFPGDLVLTLGAGDVTTIGPEVLELLHLKTKET